MNHGVFRKLIGVAAGIVFAGCTAFAANMNAPANDPANPGTTNINAVNASNPTTSPTPSSDTAGDADAQTPLIIPSAPDLTAQSYVLMDYHTGQILAQKNMNDRRAPASLTKLMTLYIVFSELKSGQITLDDKVHITKKAWKTGGSRMFVVAGTYIPVKDLIQGVIVDSGNDATVALAQYVAGTTKQFVPLMNQEAKVLGMVDTHFSDVDGLPKPDHYSTAHDLALLAHAIIKNFPRQYHFFREKYYTWDNIKQTNRNWLLFRDSSVDGLKTGDTEAAGYCLISSAHRHGMRLISVVMGSTTEEGRVDDSQRLLDYGYRFYTTYKLYEANTPVTQARVWGGALSQVSLGLADPLYLVIPKGEYKNLTIDVSLDNTIHAPINRGSAYGILNVTLNGKVLLQQPLVALTDDPKGGLWTRLSDSIALGFHNMFGKKKTAS